MASSQIHQLQQLQPEGTCILQGQPEPAHKALHELLDGKLSAVTHEWEGVMITSREAATSLAKTLGKDGQGSSGGLLLQQMLRRGVGVGKAAALRDVGAAVCVEFPVKLCCNNPGCTSMAKVGEMLLGSSCSGCRLARYCSKTCQGAAWKMGHSKVCKRITKAPAGAATAAATDGAQ
jgi:hypothetical protein